MHALRNVRTLYAVRFFQSLVPAYVIERLYWEQRGMSIAEVVYTEIIYASTIVLFEIPTGALADRYGRKKLIVLAAALGCAEFLMLLYAETFWHFAVVVALAGVASAAASGSENALLYDSLDRAGQASAFERKLGRLNALDLSASVAAALSGGFLAGRFGFELNYWLSLVGATVALALSLRLVEPPAAGSAGRAGEEAGEDERVPLRRIALESLRFFRGRRDVRLVLLSGMLVGAAMTYIDEFWQLYLDRIGVPVGWFGLFSAALLAMRMPGSLLADALLRRFRHRTLLVGALAAFAVCLACLGFAPGAAGIAAMLFACLASGAVDPIAAGYLHHRIDGPMRATIDSFRSLAGNGVALAAGLGFGWASSKADVFGGYAFLAALCAAFLLYFLPAAKKSLPS
ncbi:MFS transporter [Paenibacillus sp.]|uniref:MFS transporter n=1 Tax=Paenibacillus sp. TaxID=58172 RepID=UPI002D396938|nr:MFS transporter [Paenibacillus sp.]HZG57794.1 MFS transporter [Paenibacillus sp.]